MDSQFCDRRGGRAFRALPLFLSALLSLALLLGATSSVASAQSSCKVPRLAKKTLAAAKKALKKAGCATGKIERRPSSRVRKGRVVSTSPGAGKRLPAGAKVRLVVSQGRFCVVKRRNSKGKLVTVFTTTYAYKTVKRGGKRVRTIVKKKVRLTAPCAKRCVKQKTVNGKLRIVYKKVTKVVVVKRKIKGFVPKGALKYKLVKVRKRVSTPVLIKCTASSGSGDILGTPITITLKEGSFATLDFGTFTRRAPLSGEVKGYSPGRIDIAKDTNFVITRGTINVAPTAIFIDDDCFGDVTAAIRTGSATKAIIDSSRESTGTLIGGDITSVVALRLRAPIELRDGEEGCEKPYLTTGYTETRLRVPLFGELDTSGGFLGIVLNSSTQLLDQFDACLGLGDPETPCSGFSIPFPFLLRTHVVAELSFGSYGLIDTGAAGSAGP
jgi:PASTA domain-containing protein